MSNFLGKFLEITKPKLPIKKQRKKQVNGQPKIINIYVKGIRYKGIKVKKVKREPRTVLWRLGR